MRVLLAVLATLTLAACGGDSNEPEPPFPAVGGVYNVSGRFNALPATTSNFAGTLTLSQASRNAGTLTGTAALVVHLNQDVFNINEALVGASVSPTGVLAFSLVSGGSAGWTFTGTVGSSAIASGQHTLSDGTDNFSGTWEASKASSAVRMPAGSSASVDAVAQRLRGLNQQH